MIQEADYIVVGAGSAGCLLANRLSRDPGSRVLLLEAGSKDWNPLIRIPLVAGLLYYLPALNWGYETEAQEGLDGRKLVWPRGKVLGGSTAINGMMYIRGHASDYDHWRQLGLAGWSYEDVLPHFRAFERNLSHPRNDAFHGRDGELHTEKARGDHPLYRAWLACTHAAGFKENEDFNGPDQEGTGLYDFNIREGRRVSAATAFLAPARSRPNLSIETGVHVERLVFEGRRCTGLQVTRGGERVTLKARREVILSAGAVNSPQLLQLSGIGEAEHLHRLGIPVVLDRRDVGRNLQDHLGIYVQHKCLKPVTLYGLMRPDRAALAGLSALLFGKGPAASIPLEAGGFLKTRPELEIPDVHVTFVPGLSLATTQVGQMQHGFLTNVYQLRPESRGTILITSPDPAAKPAIQPNYLAAEADRRCLRDGVRLARRIAGQAPLDPYRGEELAPGEAAQDDAAIDSWVRQTANTIFHPVGTCRMGGDEEAVLDSELRVRGIEGLRVVDASAMPTIIGGNTSVPTMMIAEKAASMILARDKAASAA
ncbi:MAG TPA: choline dehydrogenase [Azospirillaceae bacterium]|nr:choline dehydrogenase [Azospirillaceae bacterium]